MKKGIVISVAIALMVLFVGCGISSQLAGTKWQMKYSGKDYTDTYIFDLKESGDLTITVTETYDGESYSNTEEGKWFCADDLLFIEGDTNFDGCYTVEIIKDEMILAEQSGYFYKLTKIN